MTVAQLDLLNQHLLDYNRSPRTLNAFLPPRVHLWGERGV